MTTRTLIVFYSMGGNSQRLARELGAATGADIEEIGEHRRRHGFSGALRALFDALLHRLPIITTAKHDPAEYDLLLLGGPVWAGRMASPVRSYAKRYGTAAKRIAFFCTEGGRGSDTAFADLQQLCGREPNATLVVDAAHLAPEAHGEEVRRFAAQVAQPSA